MTRTTRFVVVLTGLMLLTAEPRGAAPLQMLLIRCEAETCGYQRIASFSIDGRNAVRPVGAAAETVDNASARRFQEVKFDRLAGLYRDVDGIFHTLGGDASVIDVAVPPKWSSKVPVPVASTWQRAILEFADIASPKVKTRLAPDNFTYLLVAANVEAAISEVLQRALDPAYRDPRRIAVVRGALQFKGSAVAEAQWREAVLARIRADLKRYDDQAGDPTTLMQTLGSAVALQVVYMEVDGGSANKELLDRVTAADDLLRRRLAIAETLRKAKLWDEYLVKLNQLGVVRWSLPGMLDQSREALRGSVAFHQERAEAHAKLTHLDRAFDEAALAADRSCNPLVAEAFYKARIDFVNKNMIASALEYNGANKLYLEQIVRELEQPPDPAKEETIKTRIAQGESMDANYLPLQWKNAEFLDKLGRFEEALDVVRRIERRVRLDRQQLEQTLKLDGQISNNLLDAVKRSAAEASKEFDAQRFQQAFDAAAKGLRADPNDALLLYYSAMSAAFVRQKDAAVRSIQTYLRNANVTCGPDDHPGKMLELYRQLMLPPRSAGDANGVPSWMSGIRYDPGRVFYDPVSLSLIQPITRIHAKDGLSTLFIREDRSFLVRSISTSRMPVSMPGATSPAAASTLFEAEPKYDRPTLSMIEIGSRATSAGERTAHALRFLSSPAVDPALVFRFTSRQIARGWTGNPFFHPLIWNGFYVFDLEYDPLGRVTKATPIREEAGSRVDPFSEPLEFTWDGNSQRLMTIRGMRSGYLRTLRYDKEGLLLAEDVTYQKAKGSIVYRYLPDSPQIVEARSLDNFYDKRERIAQFDVGTIR